MIVKQDLVKKIKEYFDLNIYETKVWLALLTKGIVSAGETAELSGVPRSRTYDVLESLEKKGFAVVKLGKPVRYIAVEPNTLIEKMKLHTLHEAQDKVKTLSDLKDTQEYAELEHLHKSGLAPIKLEEISGFLRGKSNIASKIRELFGNTEKELTIYTSASDFERKARVLVPALESVQKKNIKIKLALSGDFEEVKRINARHNLKAKHTDHKGRFFITDRREVIFMISPENVEEELGVWLKAPFFSESLDTLCEYHLRKQ